MLVFFCLCKLRWLAFSYVNNNSYRNVTITMQIYNHNDSNLIKADSNLINAAELCVTISKFWTGGLLSCFIRLYAHRCESI